MRHSLTHRDKNRRFDSGLLHKFGNTRRGRYPCTLSPGKGSDKQEVCGRYDRTGTVRQDNRGLRQTLTAGKDRRHGALVSVVTHLPSKQVSPVRIRYAPPSRFYRGRETSIFWSICFLTVGKGPPAGSSATGGYTVPYLSGEEGLIIRDTSVRIRPEPPAGTLRTLAMEIPLSENDHS